MTNKKKRKRGLQNKILRLCLGIALVAVLLFTVAGILQLRGVLKVTQESAQEEAEIVKSMAGDALAETMEKGLLETVDKAAMNSDWMFWTMKHDFYVLAHQVQDVFEHPENYEEIDVYPPKMGNDGIYTGQLLFADWADKDDQETMSMMRKLGNLTPMMAEIIRGNDSNTMDCYIAVPAGVTLAVDVMSAQKFDENGQVRTYDPTSRSWYQGAVANGEIYFSSAVHSFFYDLNEVVFGVPVYVDGELVAVLEGSTKLDTLQELVSEVSLGKNSFSILVTDEGQLVYTPMTSGVLAMDETMERDIRQAGNDQLTKMVQSGLDGETGFGKITMDGEEYYAAYAPLETVGWTQMMFVSQSDLQQPTDQLLEEIDKVKAKTQEEISARSLQSRRILVALGVLLILGSVIQAEINSRKIATPISIMTKRVSDMAGDNMDFDMEEVYKTEDEIEILAEKFNELTDKLKDYIDTITTVAADQERFDAEMNVANTIQAAMLPRTFPAFPDRNEFELYAAMKPAKQVGGDLYDYYFIDDDHLALVIGDVSGKGITAALFMVMTKHIIQNQMMMKKGNVIEAITEVNKLLMKENAAGLFVTVWLGVLDVSTGDLVYINAGHEYPAISRNGGEFTIEKDLHGAPVATSRRLKFKLNELKLGKGDIVFLYTDGIPEATNARGEMFGKERMLDSLNRHRHKSPKDIDDAVRKDADEFTAGAEQFDDVTTLCFQYFGKE